MKRIAPLGALLLAGCTAVEPPATPAPRRLDTVVSGVSGRVFALPCEHVRYDPLARTPADDAVAPPLAALAPPCGGAIPSGPEDDARVVLRLDAGEGIDVWLVARSVAARFELERVALAQRGTPQNRTDRWIAQLVGSIALDEAALTDAQRWRGTVDLSGVVSRGGESAATASRRRAVGRFDVAIATTPDLPSYWPIATVSSLVRAPPLDGSRP